MGVVSTCAFSFMSKYLHQSCGQKPMTRVDINDNNQSSNNSQEDTQPVLGHLIEKFLKSYEVEIAQVLGSLGNSINKDTNRPKEYQAPASSSKPVEHFPTIDMSFPEDTTQEEPHAEVSSLAMQEEETKEQLLTDQGEENTNSSQK
jgi:hypothetical protein